MTDGNYIKVFRSLLDWEWYSNINTTRLFIHMLLKANWKDGKVQGTTVPRGSFVSSVKKLSAETDLTDDEVRTALKHLEKTGEVTKRTTNRNSIFTVVKYNYYQGTSQANTEPIPSNYQAIANPFPTIEEGKKERKEENNITVSKDTVRQTEVRRVVEAWNELKHFGIKPVSKISTSSKRYNSLIARIKERSLEDVLLAIENIKQSDFLQGKNKSGWVITFDWFVLPNNFPKVLEGNYSSRGGINNGSTGSHDTEVKSEIEQMWDSTSSGEFEGF